MAQRNRFMELDWMRALAIMIILFHHLPDHSLNYFELSVFGIEYDLSWLNDLNRYFAVGIFIFVSGFLVQGNERDMKTTEDIGKFVLKKNIRIIPQYVFAFVAFVAIFKRYGIIEINPFSVIVHLLGLQAIFASKYCRPIFTLWFVGLIMFYYYLFVVFNQFRRKERYLAALVVGVPIILIFLKYMGNITDKRIVVYYAIFVLGLLGRRYALTEKINGRAFFAALAVLIIGIWSYATLVHPSLYRADGEAALFSVVGVAALIHVNCIMIATVVVLFHIFGHITKAGIRCRMIEVISYASYSMFLFHRPIWWAMAEIYEPAERGKLALYLAVVGIPIIVFFGYSIQKAYDKYFGKAMFDVLAKWGWSQVR